MDKGKPAWRASGTPITNDATSLLLPKLRRFGATITAEQLAALREAFIASRDPSRNQGNLF